LVNFDGRRTSYVNFSSQLAQFCILITHSKNAYNDIIFSVAPVRPWTPFAYICVHMLMQICCCMGCVCLCVCVRVQFPCMFNMINFCNNSIGITRQQQLFHHAFHQHIHTHSHTNPTFTFVCRYRDICACP